MSPMHENRVLPSPVDNVPCAPLPKQSSITRFFSQMRGFQETDNVICDARALHIPREPSQTLPSIESSVLPASHAVTA